MQPIIWAFSRTSPGSADENVDLSVHHKYGIGALNLTRTPVAADVSTSPSLPTPSAAAPDVDADPKQPSAAVGDSEGGQESSDVKTGESEAADAATGSSGRGGGFTSLVHATLCIFGFLFVIPTGALVARYAKVAGSSAAFDLHRTLQFRVGACASPRSARGRCSSPLLLFQPAHLSRGACSRTFSWRAMGLAQRTR